MTAVDQDTTAPAPLDPPVRRGSSRGRLLVVCGLLAIAIGVLLYKGLLSSLNYFETVDQALDHKAALGTSSLRLEGVVVPGTVRTTRVGTDFVIRGADGRTVVVHDTGSPPQLFQPRIPVVVVGHFASATSTTFQSSQILVKHSATYVAQHPDRVRAPDGTSR